MTVQQGMTLLSTAPASKPSLPVRGQTPLVVLVLLALAPAASALTLERDVKLDPKRVELASAHGVTSVEAIGGTHEYAAGHPDLPWIAERVDLPAGMKVTAVEVLSVSTELLRDGVRVPPALSAPPARSWLLRDAGSRAAPSAKWFSLCPGRR